MTADVLKHHILGLHGVEFTPEELEDLSWRARAKAADIARLPRPRRPNLLVRAWERFMAALMDRRAYTAEIRRLNARVSMLEDALDEADSVIPGGRSGD